MGDYRRNLILAALCILLSMPVPAVACTVFAATDGAVTLAGNNEDWFDGDTYIWFLPGDNDTYGRVFYGFENAHPQGGMNEKGLFFDWFAYGGDATPRSDDQTVYQGDLSDLLLEKCATVEEALALYENYYEAGLGYASILLADSTGDMATVTWDWDAGESAVRRGDTSLAIGVGRDRVKPMLDGPDAATEETFRKMLSLSSNNITLYSTICDLNARQITVFSGHNFSEEVVFDLENEWDMGAHMFSIPALFSQKPGDTPDTFTPWNIRDRFTNTLILALGGVLLSSVIFFAIVGCREKDKLLPAAGVLTGVLYLALGFYLNPTIFFVEKYGIGILGPAAALIPWAAGALTLFQAAALCAAWAKKRHTAAVRIASTFFTLVSLACLLYLWIFA